ncbi:MAG: ATP-binding protein [bacterium]
MKKRVEKEDKLKDYLTGFIRYYPDAMITVSELGEILSWNKVAEKLTGLDLEEQKGTDVSALFSDPIQIKDFLIEIQGRKELKHREAAIININSERIPITISFTRLDSKEKGLPRILITFRDTSELMEVKKRLLETERLSAMGTIAGCVAHEIRNPLNSLFLNTDLLEDEIKRIIKEFTPKLEHRLGIIHKEIDRLNDIVDDYLSLSKLSATDLTLTNVNRLIKDSLDSLNKLIFSKKIKIDEKLTKGVPEVSVDYEQMRRALINIIKNSVQALPEQGYLRLTTSFNEDHINIEIFDKGEGIPEEEMLNLFTPFYSSKRGGTGLGLYLTREIINVHNGLIEIDSEEKKWTKVNIFLPIEEVNL